MSQKTFHHVIESEHLPTARRFAKQITGVNSVVNTRLYSKDPAAVQAIIDHAIAISGEGNVRRLQFRKEVRPAYSEYVVYYTIVEETLTRQPFNQ